MLHTYIIHSVKFYCFISALFVLLCGTSCNTVQKAWYHEKEKNWEAGTLPANLPVQHTLFLAGNLSSGRVGEANPVLAALKKQLSEAGDKSGVIFLGDNLSGNLNPENEKSVAKASAQLDGLLAIIKDFKGKTWFIAGEKDWNNGQDNGREALLWEEQYLESRLQNDEIFMPGTACGDLQKEKINDDIRLVFLDTEWWIKSRRRSEDGGNEGCEVQDRFSLLQETRDYFKKHDKERIVLLMHHPLYSNGPHGGNFNLKHHLFPLTMWKKKLYIPLPGLGSLAVLFRQLGGSSQDVANSKTQLLRRELLDIITTPPRNESVMIVSAHERSLQYFTEDKGVVNYIVSGSAGSAGYARGGRNARFVQARQGFSKLYFYENQEVWLEFLAVDDTGNPITVFRKKLYEGYPVKTPPSYETPPPPLPDSVVIAPTETYQAGSFRKIAFGNRYRAAWNTPLNVPVFDFSGERKNLTIVGQGGGRTTRSLRLEAPDGRQYVLRSVFKDVRRGRLPVFMYKTVLEDFAVDMKSGLHPYAALAVPRLADAAGIYHTNPQLVYLPHQRGLGAYDAGYGGEMYLFEERPDDDKWSGSPAFDHTPGIISTQDLIEKMHSNSKHQVDAPWVLKSRLFDLWINDTDRHDDQWRWASFPQPDGTTQYRPIPRDRDQAFFDLRGVLPFVGSRRWTAFSTRGFYPKIRDVPGQSRSAKVFDRTFLSPLDYTQWIETAKLMQASLTDAVIDNAFAAWPVEIRSLNAGKMASILKARRNSLVDDAAKLYRFHAKYVDVAGTEKRDLFEVKRGPDGQTEVSVFALKKEGTQGERFYHRIFRKKETREVRLYGLGNDDVFRLWGKTDDGIRIRIIGGDGRDVVQDSSVVADFSRKTIAYDLPGGMELQGGPELIDRRSHRLKVNEYNRNEFYQNTYFPLATFGRTVDDGFLYGGGVVLKRYRFRQRPYGVQHRIFVRTSTNTSALNLQYTGDYTRLFGTLDFNPSISFDRPVVYNFYGFGNRTRKQSEDSHYNWVRLEQFSFQPLLKKSWYNGRNFTRFGPFVEKVEVQYNPDRITGSDTFSADDLRTRVFCGLRLQHQYTSVDGETFPHNGLRFDVGGTFYQNVNEKQRYVRLETSLTNYVTVGNPIEFTIAMRVGAATLNNNNFLFYHSNNLGGNNYLRGFRNNRFSAQSMVYHNTDLRVRLGFLRNRFLPFDVGLMTGFDYGRVWYHATEEPAFYHVGFSPGIWIAPYKLLVINAFFTVTNGDEDDTSTVRVGFFF